MINKKDDNERRLKIFYVSYNLVLDLFNRKNVFVDNRKHTHFIISYFDDIPDDAHVVQVHQDHARMSFNFVLKHPSFDIVPEGEIIPGTMGIKQIICEVVPKKEIKQEDANK